MMFGLRRVKAGAKRSVLLSRKASGLTPIERFDRDGGNRLLVEDLQLTPESQVLDFGGYLGDYSAEIVRRYRAEVHIFEPVPQFAEAIRERFSGERLVTVHEVAVGRNAGRMVLYLAGDSTGIGVEGTAVDVRVEPAEYLESLKIRPRASLMAVNIEGGEYTLIPALYESGLLQSVARCFFQFHRIGPQSDSLREECHSLIAKSHRMDWDYPFVWESWTLREQPH